MLKKLLDLRVHGKKFQCNSKSLSYGKTFLYSPVKLIRFDDVKRKRL